jgi:hypothetical protein
VNHLVERLVCAIVHLPLVNDELMAPGHSHINTAPVWISFLMRVVGLLNGHIAAVDVVAKFFQSRSIIQNEIVDLVRFFQTPIRDLNRQLHDYLDKKLNFDISGRDKKTTRCHPEPRRRRGISQSERRALDVVCVIYRPA